MSLQNGVLAQDFETRDLMYDWIFSLVGSQVDFEDAPPAIITDLLSVSHSFYPLGIAEVQPGAILCTVVVAMAEKEVVNE